MPAGTSWPRPWLLAPDLRSRRDWDGSSHGNNRGGGPVHRGFRLCTRRASPLLLVHLLECQPRCGCNDAQRRVIGITRQRQSVASLPNEYALSGRVALGYLLQKLLLLALERLFLLVRDTRPVLCNDVAGSRSWQLITPASDEKIERHGPSSSADAWLDEAP